MKWLIGNFPGEIKSTNTQPDWPKNRKVIFKLPKNKYLGYCDSAIFTQYLGL